jgi:hypothetical protein
MAARAFAGLLCKREAVNLVLCLAICGVRDFAHLFFSPLLPLGPAPAMINRGGEVFRG